MTSERRRPVPTRAHDKDDNGLTSKALSTIRALDVMSYPHPLFEIREVVNANLIYVGYCVSNGTSSTPPDQTASIWRVGRISLSGVTTTTTWAVDGLFTQKFSDRATLFPAPQFVNIYATNYDGVNDYVSVPHNASIQFANSAAFSGGLYIKTGVAAACDYLHKATAMVGYQFGIVGTDLVFEFRGAGGVGDRIRVRVIGARTTLHNNQWHYVSFTKAAGLAASTVKIYIDGVSQTIDVQNDTLTGATTNTANLAIGAATGGGVYFGPGHIDEPAIWNAALTASEVTLIYNSNAGVIDLENGSGQIGSALVSWWRMGDGDTYPTILDQKGSNHGTMNGMTGQGNFESEVPP